MASRRLSVCEYSKGGLVAVLKNMFFCAIIILGICTFIVMVLIAGDTCIGLYTDFTISR